MGRTLAEAPATGSGPTDVRLIRTDQLTGLPGAMPSAEQMSRAGRFEGKRKKGSSLDAWMQWAHFEGKVPCKWSIGTRSEICSSLRCGTSLFLDNHSSG